MVWIPHTRCRTTYQDKLRGLDLVFHWGVWRIVCASGGLHQRGVLPAAEGPSDHRQLREWFEIGRTYSALTYSSKGATAVLVYGAIESPLAQPRALVGGHFIASLIGVSITKLFSLLHNTDRFDELRWLAGSLSTATAIVVMQITETTHPPAGASALLAAVSPEITELGWLVIRKFLLSRCES